MGQLLATLRRRPAPLIGTFVALTLAAMLITVTAIFLGTGLTLSVPAQQLASTIVVVTGKPNVSILAGSGENVELDTISLPDFRRVPVGIVHRLASLPGVASAVPNLSFQVALESADGSITTGTTANPIEAHGWASAPLTPFRLVSGHVPVAATDMVLGAGVAASSGLGLGSVVHLTGQDLPPFHIVGIAASPVRNPTQNWTVFLSDSEAASLYGHAGEADLIGILAKPGVSAVTLASRVRDALAGSGLTVVSGSKIGNAENLTVGLDRLGLIQLVQQGGVDILLIAFFVVSGTVALSVAMRWRNLALLRAVGATPGQVGRMITLELAVLGTLAGVVGFLPAVGLAKWALRGLAAHQLLPPSLHVWTSPWVVFIAAGAGILVAEIAGFVSVRRVSRIRPAAALLEATVEPRLIHPVRLLLALSALGGGAALCTLMVVASLGTALVDTFAILTGLLFLTAVALLGPVLVRVAELLARLPVLLFSGVGGRLALADIKRRPRRIATAVSFVVFGVSFVGANYFINVTLAHGIVVQGRERLVADAAVSAPGPGLASGSLQAIAAQPGVSTAVGLTPTTVVIPDPGTDSAFSEAVTPGPLGEVLNLRVASGSLDHFGPGDIALSKTVVGSTAVDIHVGDTITTYLADGTRYRAKVVAIYSHSLGFADALVPAGAAGGGHFGSTTMAEILVRASPGETQTTLSNELEGLSGRFAGLNVASRSVVNAQAQQYTSDENYENNGFLGLIALLAVVALVNTLVMATVERRGAVWLLKRVGTTTRQLLSMTIWETLIIAFSGLVLGVAVGAASAIVVSKSLADTWMPYLTWPPMVVIGATAVGLTFVAILVPTIWLLTSPTGEE
jgi:putative ABC transport system permease protein